MITPKWSIVYLPQGKYYVPIAAFSDRALADAYVANHPELGEVILDRTVNIGGTDAMQLLADIVSNDYTVRGDQRTARAIAAARKLLGIPAR